MKYQIFLGLFAVAAAYPGLIHEEAPQLDHQALIGETGHHHQIQHEHAKSHQSIKFEHFHPVPVYVKKEHSHLLHHPLQKGQSESNLKQIHPETQQAHGYGIVLEDHRQNTDHHAANLGHGDYSAGLEQGSLENGGLEHAGFSQELSHGGYEQLSGGYESGEGLKAYAGAQQELQGHFEGPIQVSGGSEDSHGYGHY